jgi:hypothetical protein
MKHPVEGIHVRDGIVTVVRGYGLNTSHDYRYQVIAIKAAEVFAEVYQVSITIF